MHLLTHRSLEELLAVDRRPCLSLYQPTHRHRPERQQDPIRFRNLLKELENSLTRQCAPAEAQALLAPLEALLGNGAFWNQPQDGLAVFVAPEYLRIFRLQRPVAPLAVAADSFHTKPLRAYLQTVERFQVLGVNLRSIRFFEGTRDAMDEVELPPEVPRTLEEALGTEKDEPHLTVASYGGVGSGSMPMRHGHMVKEEEAAKDAERFFRLVDRAVLSTLSRPSGLPLLLATLPEHAHLFRGLSKNPQLLEQGIAVNPEAVTVKELQALAWQVIKPLYQARMQALVDGFVAAQAKGLGSDDPEEVAAAAAAGRVGTLLIEAERRIPGVLDQVNGVFTPLPLDDARSDDLLDDLGELVEKKGGQVRVLPAKRMPTQSGVAAVYRF